MRWFVALFLCSVLLAETATGQTRTALVVGNNAYVGLQPLASAVNDALAVSGELSSRGFNVIQAPDASAADMDAAIAKFVAQISNGGIGVFYYAGHGLQIEGRNFVVPVDFKGSSEQDIRNRTVSIPALLDRLEAAKPKLVVLILDACRDNPLSAIQPQAVRTRGLGELGRPIPEGSLIIYSASSNQTALDGVPGQASKNSLFTTELLRAIRARNVEVRDLARQVRFAVMEQAQKAGHFQVPALYDNLGPGEFYFSVAPRPAVEPTLARGNAPSRIRLIVPFAAGGPSDAMIRAILPSLSAVLKSEVSIENQVDVLGDKVTEAMNSAPKDGSALLIANYTQAARRAIRGDRNLDAVGMLADVPLSLVANPAVSVSSLPELAPQAKNRGRPWNVGAGLVGSEADMCARQLQRKLGPAVINVINTQQGMAQTFMGIIQGTFDLVCIPASVAAPQITSNKLKAIAEVRYSARPGVRNLTVASTAAAQGFDIVAPNWLGIFAPKGTNPDVALRVSNAIREALSASNVQEILRRYGAIAPSSDEATSLGLESALRTGVALQIQ